MNFKFDEFHSYLKPNRIFFFHNGDRYPSVIFGIFLILDPRKNLDSPINLAFLLNSMEKIGGFILIIFNFCPCLIGFNRLFCYWMNKGQKKSAVAPLASV